MRMTTLVYTVVMSAMAGVIGVLAYQYLQPPAAVIRSARLVERVAYAGDAIRVEAKIRFNVPTNCLGTTQALVMFDGQSFKTPAMRSKVINGETVSYEIPIPSNASGDAVVTVTDYFPCRQPLESVTTPPLTFRIEP